MPENKPAWKSNLAKIDATEPDAAAYAEIPELPDAFFEEAAHYRGGVLVRRGRPPAVIRKKQVTLRLDADVLDTFRSGGPGWQSRINAALRKTLEG
jgi:uncharacterized protein (DUF4415 family)